MILNLNSNMISGLFSRRGISRKNDSSELNKYYKSSTNYPLWQVLIFDPVAVHLSEQEALASERIPSKPHLLNVLTFHIK